MIIFVLFLLFGFSFCHSMDDIVLSIRKKKSINKKLLMACKKSDTSRKFIRKLLLNGASIYTVGKDGMNPLVLACLHNKNVISVLVHAGGNLRNLQNVEVFRSIDIDFLYLAKTRIDDEDFYSDSLKVINDREFFYKNCLYTLNISLRNNIF
jgi:ankyrin repeat protein